MSKKVLFAVLVLVIASIACGRQLAEWEMTPGAITPPVNAQTLYVCVTAEKGAPFMNIQEFREVIPKGTRVIDSGRRSGPLADRWAELYYKGQSVFVKLNDLGLCPEETP